MRLAIKLAYRNLVGAGLRTWLNVFVLSLSFVVIIWHKGMLDGWDAQARTDMIAWEYAGGQYWQENYDPLDPFTLTESHAKVPEKAGKLIGQGTMAPVLVSQGTIYPEGRVQSILIKGIGTGQNVIKIPTEKFTDVDEVAIPAIIGKSMAKNAKIDVGDFVTLRWRDVNGTFDARDIKIVHIFDADVPSVDQGQIWIPIETHREMMQMPGEATLLIQSDPEQQLAMEGWELQSQEELLMEITEIIKMKSVGGSIFWIILILLAMLAIFDTQILSIFRRQKEIGTYVAMGMTKKQVIALFTVEGAFHSVLAILVGAVYGIPFFIWQAKSGISFPVEGQEMGIAMAETLYPKYGLGLVVITVTVVMIITTIVSYWPSRRIAKMKPTEALRGKIQ